MYGVEFLNIGLEKEEAEILNSDIISYKKSINRILSDSRKLAKGEKCIYCGKETTSFCNSHSIPAFSLKNIAANGELYYSNTLVNFPLLDLDKGVNNAGTFQIICRDCDGKVFKEYENPENYEKEPTSQMIAQISMKNYLKYISKRLNEHAMFDIAAEIQPNAQEILSHMQDIQNMDLNEYRKGFEKAKRLSKKNCDGEYYAFYYEKLNYVVPIAFQGIIALVADLDGQIINDIYSKNPKYHIENLHICVFPLKDSSIVMMFIDSKDKRYRNFYKKFKKLSFEEKLALINYIIFLYSEDIFLSKEIPTDILQDENLIAVSKQSSIAIMDNPLVNVIENVKEAYDLNKMNKIPNLLSKKYKLS